MWLLARRLISCWDDVMLLIMYAFLWMEIIRGPCLVSAWIKMTMPFIVRTTTAQDTSAPIQIVGQMLPCSVAATVISSAVLVVVLAKCEDWGALEDMRLAASWSKKKTRRTETAINRLLHLVWSYIIRLIGIGLAQYDNKPWLRLVIPIGQLGSITSAFEDLFLLGIPKRFPWSRHSLSTDWKVRPWFVCNWQLIQGV